MQERSKTILENHVIKLRTDNEYLDRQILFLTDRLAEVKRPARKTAR